MKYNFALTLQVHLIVNAPWIKQHIERGWILEAAHAFAAIPLDIDVKPPLSNWRIRRRSHQHRQRRIGPRFGRTAPLIGRGHIAAVGQAMQGGADQSAMTETGLLVVVQCENEADCVAGRIVRSIENESHPKRLASSNDQLLARAGRRLR